MMKRRELEIINFLYLSDEKYNKIREYRNQEYIRKVSFNQDIISEKEHSKYRILLEKKDKYFAFLITSDGKDYSVITFKEVDKNIYSLGEYLVKEEYKFEGGGIVNKYCISYTANRLKIKYFLVKQFFLNTRNNRGGDVAEIEQVNSNNGYNEFLSKVLDFNDFKVVNTKARKIFDKLYVIKNLQL